MGSLGVLELKMPKKMELNLGRGVREAGSSQTLEENNTFSPHHPIRIKNKAMIKNVQL